MQKHELVGRRAVRVDKDGRRLPGEYVVEEVSGPLGTTIDLRRVDGKQHRRDVYSRTRLRIEGVDRDFAKVLDSSPDDAKLTDADRLLECRSVLRDVIAFANMHDDRPLPQELQFRVKRVLEV